MIVKRVAHRARAVEEMDASNIFAGGIVGDTFAASVVAYLDRHSGRMYPIRYRRISMDVEPGCTPSLRQMREALVTSWSTLSDHSVEYSRYFLCLPPWGIRGCNARARLGVCEQRLAPGGGRSTVTGGHVSELFERICRDAVTGAETVCDMALQGFVLQNGVRTLDPVGQTSATLELRAHLTVADRGVVAALLESLDAVDVKVDLLTSPCMAVAAHLGEAERRLSSVVLDIGGRHACLTAFREGMVVDSCVEASGSDDFSLRVADELGVAERDLRAFVADKRDLFLSEAQADTLLLPLYGRDDGFVPLAELLDVARRHAQDLSLRLADRLRRMAAGPGGRIRQLALTGDDALAVRAVTERLRADFGCATHWIEPRGVYGSDGARVPGYARLVGMLRRGVREAPPQAQILREFNASAGERAWRWMRSAAPYAAGRVLRSLAPFGRGIRHSLAAARRTAASAGAGMRNAWPRPRSQRGTLLGGCREPPRWLL